MRGKTASAVGDVLRLEGLLEVEFKGHGGGSAEWKYDGL